MKKKILLVDDEPDILELIGYNLKKEGHEVFTAQNGSEGIKIARREKPDPHHFGRHDARNGWHAGLQHHPPRS